MLCGRIFRNACRDAGKCHDLRAEFAQFPAEAWCVRCISAAMAAEFGRANRVRQPKARRPWQDREKL
jgi:hypothetical protein